MSYAQAKEIGITDIPVIDVAALLTETPSAMQQVATEIRRAAETRGFFYIKNHSVAAEIIQTAMEAARVFFAHPLEQKQQVTINKYHRGFLRIGEAKMYDQAKTDLKESFVWGLDIPEEADCLTENTVIGPNQWPEFIPELRPALIAFFQAGLECGRLLFKAFAASLEVPEDYFIRRYDNPMARGSIIYYPPQPPQLGEEQFGVAPHTDYGCMTLLYQDSVGGLQVLDKNGEWVTAHPIEGTFVVNVGDLLTRWTNNRFASTPHRVINRSGVSRYSMGIFIDPNCDTVIEPVCREDETPLYEPITCGDYYLSRLNAAFAYRK